jgi:hypothetical protein
MDHQEIAFSELHRNDLEWHPVAVGSEEQGGIALAGRRSVDGDRAMIDDITCSLIADPVPGCGSSESNSQLMDLIVSDITAHVHRIGRVADVVRGQQQPVGVLEGDPTTAQTDLCAVLASNVGGGVEDVGLRGHAAEVVGRPG